MLENNYINCPENLNENIDPELFDSISVNDLKINQLLSLTGSSIKNVK